MNKSFNIRPIRRVSHTGLIIFAVFSVSFSWTFRVSAEEYQSSQYKMLNANLGEQPFLTAREVSPPSVTGVGPEVVEANPTSVKIKWQTDKSSNSVISYGTTPGVRPTEIAKTTEYVTTHEVEIVGLTPQTKYYFQAKSTDLYGNTGESNERSFTTPLPKPEVSKVTVKDVTSDAATITFSTDYFTTAVVEYVNTDSLIKKTVGETNYTKGHEVKLTDLADDAKYSYQIIVRDEEGNEASSSSLTFKTLRDSTPPNLTGMKFEVNQLMGKEKARVVALWTTNEPATSQLIITEGTQGNGEQIETTVDNSLITNHVVAASNLKPSTTYRIYGISTDKVGNSARSEDFVILTPKQRRTIFQIVVDNLEEIFRPFAKLFS